MAKATSITVPKPCQENWAAMSPAEKGRFCSACQETVRDFTRATDREIAAEFGNGTVCGRFLTTQLNRELIIPQQKSSLWLAASAAVMGFLALGTTAATAQNKVPTEQQVPSGGKTADNTLTKPSVISGVVNDSEGPLPGVLIIVKGTDISTQSDLDGKYTIEAKPGDTLQFSYIGYKTFEVKVNDIHEINATLQEDNENVTVGGVIFVRPPLHKRIYYSIRNWFR